MNNLGSKHSLLMKFGQFMSYYKRKRFNRKLYENYSLKTSSRLFFVLQKIMHNLYWKIKLSKQAIYIRYVITELSKFSPNQLADLLRFLFTKISLKIKKGLELVFRPHFSNNFFINIFLL